MPPERNVKLGDFFKEVTTGFITTQRALDGGNAEYNRAYRESLERAGVDAPPVHLQFRIPTVRAKLTYEFDQTDKTGFSILLVSASKDVREKLVHEVEFTLETVPLPRVPAPPVKDIQGEAPPGGPRGEVGRPRRVLHALSNGGDEPPEEEEEEAPEVDRRLFNTILRATLEHPPDEASSRAAGDLLAAVERLLLERQDDDSVQAVIPGRGKQRKHFVLTPVGRQVEPPARRSKAGKTRRKAAPVDVLVYAIEQVKVD